MEFRKLGLAMYLLTAALGCQSDRNLVSRSSDDVNICRQFLAEAGNTMQALKRETFQPRDLTFQQLQALTPGDSDFAGAEFLVLNQEWRFEKDKNKIVIICTQGRMDERGCRRFFVGYNSGECAWLSQESISELKWGDYTVLPRVR
jgi:hypothetical protein